MSESRYINTKFWNDNFIVELDPIERYLFLYFLTNEHTNIAGIYELPIKRMEQETGLEKEMLLKIIDRFKDKIHYFEGWVYIKNFSKNQKLSGKNIDIAIKKLWSLVPEGVYKPLTRGMDTPANNRKGKGKGNKNIKRAASPQKSMKNENDFSDDGLKSIDYETNEVIPELPNAGHWLIKLIFWAEGKMNKKFVNYGKQAKYISKMHKAGYSIEQMQNCWQELENNEYYKEQGIDFYTVSNEISKVKNNKPFVRRMKGFQTNG